MMRKTATSTVNVDPIAVSSLLQGTSFSWTPLSTTALCWKKIIQGAIVVPMFAMRKKNISLLNPPGKFGMRPACTTWPTEGWTRMAPGM